MTAYLITGLFPLAVLLAVSDFRRRSVSVLQLVLFGMGALALSILVNGMRNAFVTTAVNIAAVILLGLGLTLYLCIKNRGVVNPLEKDIGSGDLFFITALAPLFELREFVGFLIISMLASLAWWLVMRLLRYTVTVPLVGTLSISFMVYTTYKLLTL